jgi:hypothetical protein
MWGCVRSTHPHIYPRSFQRVPFCSRVISITTEIQRGLISRFVFRVFSFLPLWETRGEDGEGVLSKRQ